MCDRHLRALAKRERRRREHEERRRAVCGGHAPDARSLNAAVRPDAVDEGKPIADLVLRQVEDALLLVEAAGGNLRGMRVHGNGRKPLGRRHIA